MQVHRKCKQNQTLQLFCVPRAASESIGDRQEQIAARMTVGNQLIKQEIQRQETSAEQTWQCKHRRRF